MANVKKDKVIVGNGGEYKYVPVQDFLVEEVSEVFYTKHAYRLLMSEREITNINFRQRFESPSDGGARHFIENNDITRGIKTRESNITLNEIIERSNVKLAKDLGQFIKECRIKGKEGQLSILTHFRSFQTHTTGDATNTHFFSDGKELVHLPNYSSNICWGSHRMNRNMPKEQVYQQYLNMLFNLDLSDRYRLRSQRRELEKLSNVAKLHGYGTEDIEWLKSVTLDSGVSFNVFDLLIVASFFSVCVDDFLTNE